MSLRWRILGAFVLIVILTIFVSAGVEYWSAQQRLATFITKVNAKGADKLAAILSRAYQTGQDWSFLDETLYQTGYLYSTKFDKREAELYEKELAAEKKVRVVVVDMEERLLLDNYSLLTIGETIPPLAGERGTLFDFQTRQPVGYVYVDVNRDAFVEEADDFLADFLRSKAISGLLTALVSILLGIWLAKRITDPVIALTQATQALAQQGNAQLLPVTTADELGQMSAAFNQMTTALQTQRDLRQQLLSDVSHELNTPLSVIQLEAKGMSDGLQTPAETTARIMQEVNLLRTLVYDLNWLAETDSGELRLTLEPTAIGRLLATEVARWQTQAQAHEVTLSLQPLSPALASFSPVNLDKVRMSQALGNILHNALQHTETGGWVTVAVQLFSARMQTGRTIEIAITDDGIGIDPAELPHILERFYRTDQSRSRDTGGSGLGLAIARTIIEAHQGRMTVASGGLCQGTTVRFELPLDPVVDTDSVMP